MVAPDRPMCVVVAPMNSNWSVVHHEVARALSRIGFETIWLGRSIDFNSPILQSINKMLDKADLVIGDITQGNPNVMYEIGIAQGIGKPVLLVGEQGHQDPTLDLRGYIIYWYDVSRVESLLEYITIRANRILKDRASETRND